MSKRDKGDRGRVLIDTIDLSILKLLIKSKPNPLGVLEIGKLINLNHNSLKPHLDKLFSADIIRIAINKKDSRKKGFYIPDEKEDKIIFKKISNLVDNLEEIRRVLNFFEGM